MKPIRRIIRADHIKSLFKGKDGKGTLYFSPCRTFVDLLEFRFGCCWDKFDLAHAKQDPEIFNACIRETFADDYIQKRINETAITCWSQSPESPWMWEVYGGSKAAIILTADADKLESYVKKKVGDDYAVAGPVRYNFKISCVHPEFISVTKDPRFERDYDLFFHKHSFYEFENEFRAVIFGQPAGVELELPDDLITEVILPPSQIPQLDPATVEALKTRFGAAVQPSTLRWFSEPRKTWALDAYLADETIPKSEEVQGLGEKWKQIQEQMKGWNDPKGPKTNISKLMLESKEIQSQLMRLIEGDRKSQEKGS